MLMKGEYKEQQDLFSQTDYRLRQAPEILEILSDYCIYRFLTL